VRMWGPPTAQQVRGVLRVVKQQPRDSLLVAACGGRLSAHSLLLALHSPILADLLGEEGRQAVSLPLDMDTVTSLVTFMYGGKVDWGWEVEEAARWLGMAVKDQGLKMEVMESADEEEEDKFFREREGDHVKMEDHEAKHALTKSYSVKSSPQKRKAFELSSEDDDSSDEDEEDPDYFEPSSDNMKSGLNNQCSTDAPKKKRGRPRKSEEEKAKRKLTQNKSNPEYKFPCNFDGCEYRLSTILFLNRHKLLRHDEPMVCEECGMEFLKCKIYLAHKQNEHPAWTCEECGEKKKTKASLTNHIEANHKERIPCDQCGKMYGTKDCLKLHLKQEHGDHEDFQCTECEYKTRKKELFRQHVERRHTERLQATCEFCGEVFKGLKKHLQRTGCGQPNFQAKRYPCDQCDKTFFSKDVVKKHLKQIHSGVRDKVCDQCSYTTYTNYNLRLHVTKMHLGVSMVKESCPHCEKQTTNISRHIEVYHQTKVKESSSLEEQIM